LRDVTVLITSAGVIALLVMYAIAAPSVRLRTDVGAVVPRPGSSAVVTGRVLTSGGGGLDGARIEVRHTGRRVASGLSSASGAFRVLLARHCETYEITVRAPAQGTTATSTVRRRLCPGDALPLDARVVMQDHFIWVPGPR
jgi:hypothetical protein